MYRNHSFEDGEVRMNASVAHCLDVYISISMEGCVSPLTQPPYKLETLISMCNEWSVHNRWK